MKVSMDDVVVALLERLQQEVRTGIRAADEAVTDCCKDQARILIEALCNGAPSASLKDRIERIVNDEELLETYTPEHRTATLREIYPQLY